MKHISKLPPCSEDHYLCGRFTINDVRFNTNNCLQDATLFKAVLLFVFCFLFFFSPLLWSAMAIISRWLIIAIGAVVVFAGGEVLSQNIGINTTGAVPNASAGLDIDFTTKGLLIPRLTTAQRNAIASPANSLMIYNTDCKCFQVYENSAWTDMWCATGCCSAPSQPGSISGNATVSCNTTQSYNIAAVTSATSYTWSLSGGGSITSGQGTTSINVNWTVAGSFNVSVTASNSCGTSTAQTLAVTVNGPCCTLIADAGSNQTITCAGVIIGGAPTASGGTSPYSYNWSPSSGLNGTLLPNPTASPAATTIYTLTVTDAASCNATASVTITVGSCISDTWCQKANFGGIKRSGAVGFSMPGKGYIGTGYDGSYKKDFWEWDQATNVWTQKADFGGMARGWAVGFSIGLKGYIGTGEGGSYYKDFWEWDQQNNNWTQKADFGGTERYGAVGFSMPSIGKGYIGTGRTPAGPPYPLDFWEWNQANNVWTQKTDFAGAYRRFAAGFSIGNKGYIGTGMNDATFVTGFWEYDEGTNTWQQKANDQGKYAIAGFSIGNKGYFGTGDNGVQTQDFWEYTPGPGVMGGSWVQKSNFGGTARSGSVGFSIGTKGYIGTGNDGAFKQDFWEYCQ